VLLAQRTREVTGKSHSVSIGPLFTLARKSDGTYLLQLLDDKSAILIKHYDGSLEVAELANANTQESANPASNVL